MVDLVDLRELLESWPYNPNESVRVGKGKDGRLIMQVRLPLGIEQYEMDGRPDGQRPHGCESVLDHYLHRQAAAKATGKANTFRLNGEQCAELHSEGMLYYYRYLRLLQIKDWARMTRDTARNLRLFDFVQRYAEREADQKHLEQWRPYLLRMHATASAMIEWEQERHLQAREILMNALNQIEALPDMDEDTFRIERERSVSALRELARQIDKSRPISELELLEIELREAINAQAFERAAELRDQIRTLREPKQN